MLDLHNPVAGLYLVTRDVHHPKPDGRAKRGWDSKQGVPQGTVLRVTVLPASDSPDLIDLTDSMDITQEQRERLIAKRKELSRPYIGIALPGRYNNRHKVNAWIVTDEFAPDSAAFMRELLSVMELCQDPVGRLSQICPDADYDWRGIVARLLADGLITEDQIRACCDVLDAEEIADG